MSTADSSAYHKMNSHVYCW